MARRRGHRGRLAIYMEELHSIRRTGRDDPNIGLPGLSHFRRRLRAHWQSGRLDEAGYLAVESRAQAATRMMTSLFLDEMDNKPGAEFSALLATALDDGELSTRELARLETAMKDDPKIGKVDRIRLRDLFDEVVRG